MRRLAPALAATALAVLGGCAGYYPPGSYPGGAYPGSYGAPYPQSYPQQQYPATQQGIVRCESQDGRSRHCPADVRGGVALSRQLSRTDCLQGRNWGYDAGGIWVNGGCRADFVVGGYGDGGPYPGSGYGQRTLRCESVDGREKHCAASLRGAGLQKQVSRTPCIQGRNWRWDASGIWVKDGCRADFAIW
jgi:hypothetical protein